MNAGDLPLPARWPLWSRSVPYALGDRPEDIPSLTAYHPLREKATGAAIVICPGGGYWEWMGNYEGRDFALWLNEHGISAFVLKYRLASDGYHYPAIVEEVSRAIRWVRAHAAKWALDPNRIGVLGASAGGHLASYAATHFDKGNPHDPDPVERVSSRPDLCVLCYPVISTMAFESGTKSNLLGANASPEIEEYVSSECQVTPETPPCFLWHTQDDRVVPVEHSLLFAQALQQNGIPFSLHVYPSGPHGLGLGVHGYEPGSSEPLHEWTTALAFWLKNCCF